jgi:riboflavin synthase
MFSGIIEALGNVTGIETEGTNKSFWIHAPFHSELQLDQSIAHNGVCLTVDRMGDKSYRVTAVAETLEKTNLSGLGEGSLVNLERSITLQQRLDGHLVQGHVDTIGTCTAKTEEDGSWLFTFEYPENYRHLLVEKGSIAVNGVSLTAFNCEANHFTVTIIPYTFQHTDFQLLSPGHSVNLEFDILGKYFARRMEVYQIAAAK